MKQPPIKTKELSGSTVQIADGQNWEIASITAYGETPQGGTTEAPVALTGISSVTVNDDVTELPIPRPLHKVGDVRDVCQTRVKSVYDKHIVLSSADGFSFSSNAGNGYARFYKAYNSAKLSPIASDWLPGYAKTAYNATNEGVYSADSDAGTISIVLSIQRLIAAGATSGDTSTYLSAASAIFSAHPLTVYYQSTAYDGTNGLDVCLTEYQNDFVELDGTETWSQGTGSNTGYLQASVLKNTNESHLAVSSIAPFKYQFSGNCVFVTNNKVTFGSALGRAYTVDTWKAYLAAQKAAGTPVQVAYQLATPETYATDPLDIDNAAGPLTVMTGGELEVTLTHRMLTPYTAWTIQYDSEGEYTGDFFNVEDYDRIKQNIEYLREYAYFLYGGFTMRGMVAVTVESYGYASTIDALDANLEAIAANTFRPPDMMPVKQWRGNQPPPGADDWNRIENTCLLLFEQFERQFACLPKLAFELKGSAF